MFIEAVTVCVNYGDFLVHTLPHNKKHFNKYVVVTSTSDTFTKKICDFFEVECVQTDVFYSDGQSFNKAKGINEGIKRLIQTDWIVHLDADIYLTPNFKTSIVDKELNKSCLYGMDRLMCNSYEEWMDFLSNPLTMYDGLTEKFKLGTRFVCPKDKGYIPLGYFQLWNCRATGIIEYPDGHDKADFTDLQFSKQWPKSKRNLIGDNFVIHLDSEPQSTMGANWSGRKTPLFGKSKFDIIKPNIKQKNSYGK